MTKQIDEDKGLVGIKRALISVSDKTGIEVLALTLAHYGVEMISSSGTGHALRQCGHRVTDVSQVTGFPEMMDGRIKTLHPKVHGGLLALRDNAEHLAAMQQHGIEPIDLVVVNLYPFTETIKKPGATRAQAVEQIDIGGPAMIRSAAKNADSVAVITSPRQIISIVREMERTNGSLCLHTRRRLAKDAFSLTAKYDRAIASYLRKEDQGRGTKEGDEIN
jgi:phosphoribosylaminoimidazolecarboxamide formyltransferase / IMP cyclohydrolase